MSSTHTEELMVVEADDGEAYIGQVRFDCGGVFIYTGRTGRPPFIPQENISRITQALLHPDVEETQ